MHLRLLAPLTLAMVAAPAAAQLGLPVIDQTLGRVKGGLDSLVDRTVGTSLDAVQRLASVRTERLERLVRDHRDAIEFDADGQPARHGELLLEGADDASIARAVQAGFTLIAREDVPDLGFSVVRLGVPAGRSLARAQRELRDLLPEVTIAADQLYLESGAAAAGATGKPGMPAVAVSTRIGVIDGAPGSAAPVAAMRGFARGAPFPSDHGSAVVSLLRQAGGANIVAADVYGTDPAGGNAMAIAQALGWMVAQQARIVSISLVGPRNPVLERAIKAAQARGAVVVAAVGNDGPAAPPSFPASYPGVLAVTAVDGRDRALIEAGRALHLDYAAPGADMLAANAAGVWKPVRGTSFAAPLVAVRAAHAVGSAGARWQTELDREARDLGRRGPDPVFGRGLLCGLCRRTR
ncbi:S8 family serine peptidase [Novosphingobium sp.]|uniref:S8 family serine peptidase n=1 Tax=Novosphingobium sp. TaxID=1874826 RepID=UPI003BAAC3BA